MGDKISIIVPIYNVEKYVGKCIESILAQSYTNFELILVNDGSTDISYDICREYEQKDERIRLITQENGGVSKARNAGLSIANGDWIGFVDADDYIEKDYYQLLIDEAKKGVSDIICCGIRAVNEQGAELPHLQTQDIPGETTVLSKEEAFTHFFNPSKRYILWSPWDKLIKADLAKKFEFEVGRKIAEDFYYCYQCIENTNTLTYIPYKRYNYLIRPGSAIQSKKFAISAFDSIYFASKALEDLKKQDVSSGVIECGCMSQLIVAARTVRSYYKAEEIVDKNTYNYDEKIKECKDIIKKAPKKIKKMLNKKHRFLLFEAASCPLLFKIR